MKKRTMFSLVEYNIFRCAHMLRTAQNELTLYKSYRCIDHNRHFEHVNSIFALNRLIKLTIENTAIRYRKKSIKYIGKNMPN